MKRRKFIALLCGVGAALPLMARAQPGGRTRRIGVLVPGTPGDPLYETRIKIFREELQKLGWADGRNVQIDVRWGEGDFDRIGKYASELAAIPAEVVFASGVVPVQALRRAIPTVPIVFVLVVDPVGQGIVESLARPGGNVTGFTQFEFSICGKWVELLRQVASDARRVGVLRHPTDGAGVAQYSVIQAAAQPLGMELSPIDSSNAGKIEQGITTFASAPNRGLIVATSQSSAIHRELIVTLAARHRLPAVYPFNYFTSGGGLISYGPDLLDQYRRAAGYCDRILKGEKPADLPVQQPTAFELVINLKTARTLGLTVPDALLATANEVIE